VRGEGAQAPAEFVDARVPSACTNTSTQGGFFLPVHSFFVKVQLGRGCPGQDQGHSAIYSLRIPYPVCLCAEPRVACSSGQPGQLVGKHWKPEGGVMVR